MIVTLLIFLIIVFCLGFTLTFFVKNNSSFLERNIMRFGFGLAIFIILIVLLNLLRIPLIWWIFFLISILYPLYYLINKFRKKGLTLPVFKLNKTNLYIVIAFIIFLFSAYIYIHGSMEYPWLEDGDPWIHAVGIKYISLKKTAYEPEPYKNIFQYFDIYPPAYEGILGILFQVEGEGLINHMKFFNGLIAALGILFFFFFAKLFTNSRKKALIATFVLAMLPSYLSHFIWAHALFMTLVFPLLYSLEKIRDDRRWKYISALMFSSLLLTQPSQSIKFSVFLFVYLVAKSIANRKIWKEGIYATIMGAIISLLWWIPIMIKRGLNRILSYNVKVSSQLSDIIKPWYQFKVKGSADKVYSFKDFLIVGKNNMINNPIGMGWMVTILFIFTILILIFIQYNNMKNNKNKMSKNHYYFLCSLLIISLLCFFISFFSPINLFIQLKINMALQVILFMVSILSLSLIYLILIFKRIYNPFKIWIPVTLIWLAIAIFGLQGELFPIQFIAFRFWMWLAVFISLILSEGIPLIKSLIKEFSKTLSMVIMVLIIILIVMTSGYQKYSVNTAQWPTTASLMKYGQLDSWIWLDKNIPDNSNIYYACGTKFGDFAIITYDKWTCYWCKNIRDSKSYLLNQSATDIYDWLKQKDYKYIIMDGNCIDDFGENHTNQKIKEIADLNLFQPVYQSQGFIMWSLV